MLSLFEEFDVPATWAVVGHLLLEDCDGHHWDHPAGPAWFARERTTWASRPDLRFGDGLVERIRSADVDHEIGCHTFSHVEFGDERTSPDVARAELERCEAVAAEWDLSLKSFVFPRNKVGYRDLLAEYGYESYRGWPETAAGKGAARKLAEATVAENEPRLVTPTVDEYGLVNVPPSLFLFSFEGLARRMTAPVFGDPIVAEARRGIDEAIRKDGVYHLWLHPNNLTSEDDVGRLRRVLGYLNTHRHEVSIATMDAVAERTLADQPQPVAR